MKRNLFLLFVSWLLVACAEDETTTFGSISGVVKDKNTAEALVGVRVTITPGGDSSVTGADGNFQFKDLDAADYTVSYIKEGYISDSKKVTVSPGVNRDASIMLEPIAPILAVSPSSLDFGSELTTLALDITNIGKGTLQWSIAEEISWLSCQPDKGTTTNESSSIVVKISRDGLERGTYVKTIVISSNGGSLIIPVTVSVENINIAVEPNELNFGTLTNSLQLTLKNTGFGINYYKIESSKDWLVLSKASGVITETDYITAIVAREGLSASKYEATITISTNGGNIVIPVKMEVAVEAKPTVTVENVSDITSDRATLHGTIVSVGSSKVTRYGFCWSEQPNPTIENSYCTLGDTSNPTAFESTISNLKSETKYYFRSYAENSVGITYSEKEQSFTTTGLPTLPIVASVSIEEITSTSAVAKGVITSLGNVAKITHYGFVWSISARPTLENAKYNDIGECDRPQSYTSQIHDLDAHTLYYIRAYAINEKGTAYGEDLTFTTANTDVRIATAEVTDITHNAATSGGTISDDGGHTITEKGVCWSSNKDLPTISDNHISTTANATSALTAYGLYKKNASRSEYLRQTSDSYSCRINGLSKNTLYHIRAYVKTSSGSVFYGDVKQFTTTEEIFPPSLANVTISNIQTTSATFISKIESNGNGKITECGFCYSIQPKPTVENGTKIICDPASSEFGKNATGLTDNTQYYVRSYAKNEAGISYSEDAVFTTLAITVPILGNVTYENVGRTTAYVSATITDTGNTSITECGFCWSTNPYPTIYDNSVSCEVGTTFKTKLQDLPLLTTVYVRAFAINAKGTGYSDDVSFITTDTDIDIWDGSSVATKFEGGMGTESDPIIINSAAQLKLLADNVNGGTTYAGVFFNLTVDINLNNQKWTPIGSSTKPFKGSFNGQGHKIYGLFINSSKDSYQGLFGYISNGKYIANLHLDGRVLGDAKTGGLIGMAYNYKTIVNCHAECDVQGRQDVGGLIGYVECDTKETSLIVNCSNQGSVSGTDFIGGIIGYSKCYGYNEGRYANIKIANVFNCGDINGDSYVGGIIGNLYNYPGTYYGTSHTTLENCINYSNITGKLYKGGIIGRVQNSSSSYDSELIINNTYWLYDIVGNFGLESGYGVFSHSPSGKTETRTYYMRNSINCILSSGLDLVTVLNQQTIYKFDDIVLRKWEYEITDGYARPVFEK